MSATIDKPFSVVLEDETVVEGSLRKVDAGPDWAKHRVTIELDDDDTSGHALDALAVAVRVRFENDVEAHALSLHFPTAAKAEEFKRRIVATGVVDFLDDNKTIRSILAETVRVTRQSGDVFIAFHKMRERVERVLDQLGMFVEDGRYYCMRRILRAEFESPRLLVRLAKADRGILFALLALLKMQFLSRKLKGTLTAAVPELAPYRREDEVRQLFDVLGVTLHQVYTFETCTIVQLKANASPLRPLSHDALLEE